MRSIGRAAALVAVVGMPMVAYALTRVAVSISQGMDSASLADASVAVEDGLTLLAAVVGAAIASYLALTGYAMLVGAAWRGGRAIPKALASLAPAGWTRVTATALGLSLSAGLAAPALAAETGSAHVPSAGWVDAPVSVVVDAPVSVVVDVAPRAFAGWVAPPSSVSTSSSTTNSSSVTSSAAGPADVTTPSALVVGWVGAGATQETPPPPSVAYVVQAGDSLWRITESLVGTDVSAAQVSAEWPRLYEANRDAIGDDPSLIHAGLELTIPAGFGA